MPTFSRTAAIMAALPLLAIAGEAHADCTSLDGVYANDSTKQPVSAGHSLTEFAPSKESSHLFLVERPGGSQPGFASGAVRSRPKVTPLAATVRLHYNAGRLVLTYMDAKGKTLAETAISNSPARWKCVGDRLQRDYQTTGGLGDRIRTERTREELFADADGLHFGESATTVGTAAPARRTEVTFKRIAKPEAGGK